MTLHTPSRAAWVSMLLIASVAASGCGTRDAAETTPAAKTPAPAVAGHVPARGELLLAAQPEGWKETGAMHTPALRMAEYGPDQEAEDRVERLTFEAQSGKPLPDPINFVLGLGHDLEARCQGFQGINVSSGRENGYPTSVRLMICPKLEDATYGQVVMAKAIQGNDDFYVITHRLRMPPFKGTGQPLTAQAMAEWTVQLRETRLCDTRGDDHPCPREMGTTVLQPPDASAPATTPERTAAEDP